MALVELNGRLFDKKLVLKENQIKKAIALLEKYEKLAEGDEFGKLYRGTIPWYERQLLDDYFWEHKHDDGYWVVHFKSGAYRANNAIITWHISNKRSVELLMLEAGFLPGEIKVYLEQYTGENLVALGKTVENGLFKPENIKF